MAATHASTQLLVLVAAAPFARGTGFEDFFTTYSSAWSYADETMGTTDGCKVWYLKNHSEVNSTLSLGEGQGLQLLMTSAPCKSNPASCHGAKMAADHLASISTQLDGDYELRMRAPYQVGSAEATCSPGVYAYFTAGYVNSNGKWNEMNFGFHPDRDNNGTAVSCEHHDDTGGYHETTVDLGFNYRMSFSVFKISLRKGHIQWLVGRDKEAPKLIYEANATLTEPMTTRIILRTNFRDGDPGYLPDHVFEISHFRFVPVDTRV